MTIISHTGATPGATITAGLIIADAEGDIQVAPGAVFASVSAEGSWEVNLAPTEATIDETSGADSWWQIIEPGPSGDTTWNVYVPRIPASVDVTACASAPATEALVPAPGPPGTKPLQVAPANLQSPGTSQGTTGRLYIVPASDTENAIQIQIPDASYGVGEPYGEGQALIVYKAGSGEPINQVLLRIDGNGGIGTAGGAHFAFGLNQPGYTSTQNVWIDQNTGPAPAAQVALVITAAPGMTGDMVQAQTHAGVEMLRVAAPGVNGASGCTFYGLDDTGANNLWWLACGSTAPYQVRAFISSKQTNEIALAVATAPGSTVPICEFQVSGTGAVLNVLPSGQLKTVAANETTGAGSAALGANCPAVTATAPYKWEKITTSDGSECYFPVWK